MSEKQFRDIVVGLDKHCGIDARTALQKVLIEFIGPGSYALIEMGIKPFTETIKYMVRDQRAMVTLVVTNGGNCVQAC